MRKPKIVFLCLLASTLATNPSRELFAQRIIWGPLEVERIPVKTDQGVQFNGLAVCRGTAVAVGTILGGEAGANQPVFWSRPATTGEWTDLTALVPIGARVIGVSCIDNEFFVTGAASEGALILRSKDGVNWAETIVPRSAGFSSIAFGGGRYVATEGERILTSADARSWTPDGVTGQFSSMNFRRVEFLAGRFYALGINSATGLQVSKDGLAWTPVPLNQPSDLVIGSVDGRDLFVAVGPTAIYTSTNGLDWTPEKATANSIAFGNGVFIAGGLLAGSESPGRVFASLDGVRWEPAPEELYPPFQGAGLWTFDIGEFFGIGPEMTFHRLRVAVESEEDPGEEQVAALRQTLLSDDSTVEEKLDAIGELLLIGSESASGALQEVVKSGADPYVRERAALVLGQMDDPRAIPVLTEAGLKAEASLRQAAQNAVWALRKKFPLPDPPVITLEAVTPIVPGEPFTVEGRVLSPVDRAQIQIRFRGGKAVPLVAAGARSDSYKGPVRANEEIVLRGTFLAPAEGQAVLALEARVTENQMDATTYKGRLFVDVRPEGGIASSTPFPEWTETTRHYIEDPDRPVRRTAKDGIERAATGERDILVRGTVLYQDGNPGPMLAFTPEGAPKPGQLVKVLVVDPRDRDRRFGEGWTDSQGRFFVVAEEVPDNQNLDVVLEIDNFMTKLYLDTDLDIGGEEFFFTLTGVNAGTSGGIDIGTNVVPPSYRALTVDENGFWPGGEETHTVSFGAAMNVNEVIRVTREDIDSNRDPSEGDSIGQVDVEYGDSSGTHYYMDLVLVAALIDGAVPMNNTNGVDDAWIDATVAHEYTHHLQFQIGSWDAHAGSHFYCTEIESFWWNASEFAFSEGFANYYGNFIALTKPGMSTFGVNDVEGGCGLEGSSTMFTSTPRSQEAWFNVEGHVTAFLWDLADGWGSGDDAWDQIDGAAINGHRVILQIFDNELDDGGKHEFADDAPDLREFYEAWLDRFPGLNFVSGHPVADAVLNATGIVPGIDSSGAGEANRPFPIVEPLPAVPTQSEASLRLPDGSGVIPQYDAPVPAPHVDGQPVLTIRRHWSYIDAVPGTPNPDADQLTVQLGFSNLGPVRMGVDVPVAKDNSAAADWTANIVFSPNVAGWLEVFPSSGRFSSTNAFVLQSLPIAFTPVVWNLAGGQQYTADIELTYQTLNQTETRLIRVILDQWTGPDEDTDNDGLTNREERDRAQSDLGAFGCLRPRDPDSDDDGLKDGDELKVYGTSPCERDTDGDGMWDGLEVRYPCLNPTVADADQDPDMDGLTNAEEVLVTFQTDPCDGDTDDDGALDGVDNCRLTANTGQEDLDQDGRGDACDGDIDGDGCANLYDPNPADIQNPDEACLSRPADPSLTRSGRLRTTLDPRLEDARLHVLIDSLRPRGPGSCGEIDCPPPSVTILSENGEVLSTISAADHDYDQFSGFGSAVEWIPDLDSDGLPDLAIGVPNARRGAGEVLLVSSKTGGVLSKLEGKEPGERLGETLALLDLNRLAIGAPGGPDVPGGVYVAALDGSGLGEPIRMGAAGDRFGASLISVSWEKTDVLLIGAPGHDGRGGVFVSKGEGAPDRIAAGSGIGDEFGAALAHAGDLNEDGIPEVLAGSPGADLPPRGGTNGQGPKPARFTPTEMETADAGAVTLLSLDGRRVWTVTGSEPGERLGSAVAALTGEGSVPEFLVGAPGWRNGTGRAYVITASDEVKSIIPGEVENSGFGAWVAAGPDYDGDGSPSLLITETGLVGPDGTPGRTTAFQAPARPMLEIRPAGAGSGIELLVRGAVGVEYEILVSRDLVEWESLRRGRSEGAEVRVPIEEAEQDAYKFYKFRIATLQ